MQAIPKAREALYFAVLFALHVARVLDGSDARSLERLESGSTYDLKPRTTVKLPMKRLVDYADVLLFGKYPKSIVQHLYLMVHVAETATDVRTAFLTLSQLLDVCEAVAEQSPESAGILSAAWREIAAAMTAGGGEAGNGVAADAAGAGAGAGAGVGAGVGAGADAGAISSGEVVVTVLHDDSAVAAGADTAGAGGVASGDVVVVGSEVAAGAGATAAAATVVHGTSPVGTDAAADRYRTLVGSAAGAADSPRPRAGVETAPTKSAPVKLSTERPPLSATDNDDGRVAFPRPSGSPPHLYPTTLKNAALSLVVTVCAGDARRRVYSHVEYRVSVDDTVEWTTTCVDNLTTEGLRMIVRTTGQQDVDEAASASLSVRDLLEKLGLTAPTTRKIELVWRRGSEKKQGLEFTLIIKPALGTAESSVLFL